MQREIKFRGQRVDTKEWVYGYLIECGITGESYIFPIGNDVNESERVGEEGCLRIVTYEVIPETVGQFTGLKDKNEKEIYESDLIEIKTEKHHFVSEITWDSDIGGFEFQDTENTYCGLDAIKIFKNGSSLYGGYVEVIGNIYQDPELLQGVSNE
jgi:uncharacterized phage protein (TIGR01671 family)